MWKKINYLIRDYFGFNHTETKGFIVMMGLLILLLIAPFLLDLLPDNVPDTSLADKAQADSLMASLEIRQKEAKQNFSDRFDRNEKGAYEHDFVKENKKPVHLFNFNPNEISSEQWQELGTPRWMAERIMKYRAKGGSFRKKEDVLKIYDFPKDLYASIEPYIQLPVISAFVASNGNNPTENKPLFEKKAKLTITAFDLNQADTTELIKLKGIGSKLAMRIVKFRDNLGGFTSENQVREVWGLDSTVVDEVLKYGFIKNPSLRKIKINTVPLEELKHPYLKPYIAKIIIAYRQQHGNFTSAKDLQNIKLLDAATLEKLLPYIEF